MKTLIKCFWIFLLGSFIGCIVEEIWCFIRNKCFQIRSSLLHMPLIPIYGFAALFIIIIADKVGYSLWKVFIIGTIVATIVEYLCSYFQEKIFKTKSWDYSEFKYNLNGRVNLVYSIGFGFISMMVIKYIKNFAIFVNGLVNSKYFINFSILIFILFTLDVIISSGACLRYGSRKEGIVASNSIERFLDKYYPDDKVEKIYNNSIYVG